MNFLEKDLETIIWENYEACEQRELRIKAAMYVRGKRIRQMGLGSYGIADLVNIYFNPVANTLFVQVIECKRQKITEATYLQAKRYAAAVDDIIIDSDLINRHNIKIETSVVLVGASIDTSGNLAMTIAQDRAASAFIYKYGLNGIEFHDVSNYWWLETSATMNNRPIADNYSVVAYVKAEIAALGDYKHQYGDFDKALLITSTGVLINPDIDFLS